MIAMPEVRLDSITFVTPEHRGPGRRRRVARRSLLRLPRGEGGAPRGHPQRCGGRPRRRGDRVARLPRSPRHSGCHRGATIRPGSATPRTCAGGGGSATATSRRASSAASRGRPAPRTVRRMAARPAPDVPPEAPVGEEARFVLRPREGRSALRLSAAIPRRWSGPRTSSHIVVTGSHCGALPGRPGYGLGVRARGAVFNDAGGGAGVARLPRLDAQGIPGAAVAAASARIGEARSTWETGIISAANEFAAGARGAGRHDGPGVRGSARLSTARSVRVFAQPPGTAERKGLTRPGCAAPEPPGETARKG